MRFTLFQYPLPAPPELDDLNAFLRSNRIAAVEHQLVTSGTPMLIFVVQSLEASSKEARKQEPRVDYREELGEELFPRYSRLREERKRIAEEEGVPVYAVFTNAQLASIVRAAPSEAAGLAAVDGIGAARIEKYGERILKALSAST